jgi:hypothetical protein
VVKLSTQIGNLIDTVQEFKEDYKEMKETVKSLEKTSSFLSGAYKGLCITIGFVSSLLIFKQEIGSYILSLNDHSDQQSHFAVTEKNNKLL